MGFLARLFGRSQPSKADSRLYSQVATGGSRVPDASANATRRELLRVVLADTLRRQGIPSTWISAEALTATSRNRESGIHWRLLIRHWNPQIMFHAVGLQNRLIGQVQLFDPMAEQWLMGVSWQFALPDESVCPELPHPGSWTGESRPVRPPKAAHTLPGGSGDVISGPVQIADAAGDAMADLERLLAVRDAELRESGRLAAGGAQEATQPMYMKTQPHKL